MLKARWSGYEVQVHRPEELGASSPLPPPERAAPIHQPDLKFSAFYGKVKWFQSDRGNT